MASNITVNGNTIDSASPAHRYADASQSDFIYIKGNDDLTAEQKQSLDSLGVQIQEYVDDKTYKCKYTHSDLETIRNQDFVNTANVFEPVLKTDKELKDSIGHDPDRTEYEVDILLHEDAPQAPAEIAPEVARRAGVNASSLYVGTYMIRLNIHQDKIDEVAAIDSVNRIKEVIPNQIHNNVAREILFGKNPSSALKPDQKYQGLTQTVCVADTGLDTKHGAFKDRSGRIKTFVYPDPTCMSDGEGHGTHVCGSILGNGTATDVNGKSVVVQGTAPKANLVMQGVSSFFTRPWDGDKDLAALKADFDGGEWRMNGLPPEVDKLFTQGKAYNAFIHSNSWGPTWNNAPAAYENAVDQFTFSNQDVTILYSAGNDNWDGNAKSFRGPKTVGGWCIAKNCITVGATESSRTDGNIDQPAFFSSRGPTADGRIKPDVMAPGTQILSAGSGDMSKYRSLLNEYNGNAWNTAKRDWIYMSGTSMATPLVAGCVAVLREAVIDRTSTKNPSAALLKAMLINGTVDLEGTQDKWNRKKIDPAPNGDQGFGRVDLGSSLIMTDPNVKNAGFIDAADWKRQSNATSLKPQTSWKNPTPIPRVGTTFKATLVYPEKVGQKTQNYVHLIVKSKSNTERHGNINRDLQSNSTEFDTVNTVEKVVWKNPPAGELEIEVRATAFTLDTQSQPFACVWMWN